METTLLVILALMLAGTLALLWRLRLRVLELEETLRSLAPLGFLPDRMQALAKRVEALDLEPTAKEIERLAGALQRLEDLAISAPQQPQEEFDPVRAARAQVIRALRDEGYTSIRIVAEEEDFAAEPAVLEVHAQRNGVLVRGTVELSDGEIGALDLEPSYSAFP